MKIVRQHGFRSVAFPIIGAGSGGFDESGALTLMQQALAGIEHSAEVIIVRYRRRRSAE